MSDICHRLNRDVVSAGICTGCGACAALDATGRSEMIDTDAGPIPRFPEGAELPALAWEVCPGKGLPYRDLYLKHYGRVPDNGLLGCWQKVRTGHAADPDIRRAGASGGVLTRVLIHLLETGRIDAAVVVQQGLPVPEKARVRVARSRQEILDAAGSVYIPVSTLDILSTLEPGRRYAMTCLPDQAAALRLLQQAGHLPARQVRYVLGPYTGTALRPAAIRSFLQARGMDPEDRVTRLQWRAGEWPGYLEVNTASGRVFRARKFYYNYLIPFFITQASLQSMDFTNEFCDLSVGDAWSPRFEALGGGFSVVTSRSAEMESVIVEMIAGDLLKLAEEDPLESLSMHGHMLDFKKRGSYIRNRMRRLFGLKAPEYGLKPEPLPVSRVAVECVVMSIFALAGTRLARAMVRRIPESIIGPAFDGMRRAWKAVSKPTKRKGLRDIRMRPA